MIRIEGAFQILPDGFIQLEPTEWSVAFDYLQRYKFSSKVYFPVDENSFAGTGGQYGEKIQGYIREGYIDRVYVTPLDNGTYKLMHCIEDRGLGDADGYGVEPDTWLIARADKDGKVIERFRVAE